MIVNRGSGDTVDYLAPSAIAAGTGLILGALFAICYADVVAGDRIALQITGVHEFDKDTGVSFNVGDHVYFDVDAQKATTDTTKFSIGLAFPPANDLSSTVAAASDDSTVRVRLQPQGA